MALRIPLVMVAGRIQQLQSADAIAASLLTGRFYRVDLDNGNDGTGKRGRWDLSFATYKACLVDASIVSGDVIFLGAGTFAESTQLTVPAGIITVGAGKEASILNSSYAGSTPSIVLGSNCVFQGFHIITPTGISMFGSQVSAGYSGVVMRDMNFESTGVDVLFFNGGTFTYQLKLYDCDLSSKFDTYNCSSTPTIDIEFWNCGFLCDGNNANTTRCISSNANGNNARAYNCKFKTLNAGSISQNRPVSCQLGRIELHNCVIDNDASGALNQDLFQSGGTLFIDDVVRDDGKALITSGVISYLNRSAEIGSQLISSGGVAPELVFSDMDGDVLTVG